MCGILGQINIKNSIKVSAFTKMRDTLTHRGPDDAGIYFDENNQIALAHRRLSFFDLTSNGKQPMANQQEDIWLTYNGEIYNFLEIKETLKTFYNFTTHTDSEVIIAAYQKWGIDCVNKFKGMFAFAIYDKKKQKMFLVRDRFGIKPLYYYQDENQFIFASELKAIHASNTVDLKVNYSSFCDFFVYRYIPSPKTIWQNTYKLDPAHYIEIDTKTLNSTKHEYWTLASENNKIDEKELIKEVDEILSKSIIQQAKADVEIGSFLSGGYDSSALVHYLVKDQQKPKTFSIGFDQWEKSEHYFAKIVADKLDVSNEKLIADENSLNEIEKMPMVYDEPIADISIIPTYMVSQLARKSVKAVLSGEGADEIFGGYTWQKDFYNLSNTNSIIKKIRQFFDKQDTVDFYANAMAMGWFDAEELKKLLQPDYHKFISKDVHWFYRKHFKANLSPLKSIQHLDMKCFMGELVLTKVDRASMANSLEVRVPFLDHHLYEKIFHINEKHYFKPNKTKFLIFENLKDRLPQEILNRKKQGFVGPDSYYMNKDWYKKQLKNSILIKNGIIRQEYIDELLSKDYDWKIWKILVMEKWMSHWS